MLITHVNTRKVANERSARALRMQRTVTSPCSRAASSRSTTDSGRGRYGGRTGVSTAAPAMGV
ncbi:MAG: hypothetical protein ACN6I5_01140 [Hyphomicrobiales bacterium]